MMTSRAFLLLTVFASLVPGCGGLSEDEAKSYCDRARQSESQCFNDEAYSGCLSCYEDCGVDCTASETCPRAYTCN